jgi:anthranilate phosphoribosyltransferase
MRIFLFLIMMTVLPAYAYVLSSSTAAKWMDCLEEGIKAVGVGKMGSKALPQELVPRLQATINETQNADVPVEVKERMASFLGTLFLKQELGPTDEEVLATVASIARRKSKSTTTSSRSTTSSSRLRCGCSSLNLLSVAAPRYHESDETFVRLVQDMLDGKTLPNSDARCLGRILLDPKQTDTALKAMAMHILRVRYETADEWLGLLGAQEETVIPTRMNGRSSSNHAQLLVQLSEPFDGVNRSPMLSPLIAWWLQKQFGARVVSLVGQNPGPKVGPNLLDLALAIQKQYGHDALRFLTANEVEEESSPTFGWCIDVESAAPLLASLVPLRRNIMKRPFLATSEKLLNPCGADVVIVSAFHPSYTEKMFKMIEGGTAFPSCICVRKGVEGSLTFSLGGAAEIVCGARKSTASSFERMEFSHGPPVTEPAQTKAWTANELAETCMSWVMKGTTDNDRLDRQISTTLEGYTQAFEWVMERLVQR